MLREHRSQIFLQELKVKKPTLVLPDLAFGLSPVAALPAQPFCEEESLKIGVTIIDRAAQDESFSRQRIYEDALVSLTAKLTRDHGSAG